MSHDILTCVICTTYYLSGPVAGSLSGPVAGSNVSVGMTVEGPAAGDSMVTGATPSPWEACPFPCCTLSRMTLPVVGLGTCSSPWSPWM